MRAALISRQRELRTHDRGVCQVDEIGNVTSLGSSKTTQQQGVKEAYATPLSQIFSSGLLRKQDKNGGVEEGRVAAAALDAADLSVFESHGDHERSTGVFIVRTRKVVTSKSGGHGISDPISDSEPPYYIVRRSIADFSWLEHTLQDRYEAVIVPSLPPMALAGRLQYGYAYDFERRRGLEKFVRRVATHVVLATVDEVLAFLGVLDEDTWHTIRRDSSRHQSVISSALFGLRNAEEDDPNPLQWISRWSSYKLWQAGRRLNKGIASFLERDNPVHPQRKQDTADARLGRLKTYVDELGNSLEKLRRASSRAASARAEHVRSDDALGLALVSLGEKEGGQFGRLLQCVGIAQSVTTSTRASLGSSRPHSPNQNFLGSSSSPQDSSSMTGPATPGRSKSNSLAQSPANRAAAPGLRISALDLTNVEGVSAADATWYVPRNNETESELKYPQQSPSARRLEHTKLLSDALVTGTAEVTGRQNNKRHTRHRSLEAATEGALISCGTSRAEDMDKYSEIDDRAHGETSAEPLELYGNKSADSVLEEILRDYEQRSDGAKRIMAARLDEQEAYEHALEVYTKLRDKLESRTGSMWKSNVGESDSDIVAGKGVEELYDSVTSASEALADARKQYQEIAVATTEELRRLRSEMHADFAAALCAIAQDNAQHHASRAAAWSALARQCESYTSSSRGRAHEKL